MEHALVLALIIALVLSLRFSKRTTMYKIVRVQPHASGLESNGQRKNSGEALSAVRFEIPKDFRWNSPRGNDDGRLVRLVDRAGGRSASDSNSGRAEEKSDIASALRNLGCKKEKAQSVAHQAIGKGTDWDSRLKWALQNAA